MSQEPETVGEQAEAALTGRIRKGTNFFLAFMTFMIGLGIGISIGLLIAWMVVSWAAEYQTPPLPTRGPLHPTPTPTRQIEWAAASAYHLAAAAALPGREGSKLST